MNKQAHGESAVGEVSVVCEVPNPFVSAQGFMHQIKKSQSCFLKHLSPLSRPIRYTFKVSHSGATDVTPLQKDGFGLF